MVWVTANSFSSLKFLSAIAGLGLWVTQVSLFILALSLQATVPPFLSCLCHPETLFFLPWGQWPSPKPLEGQLESTSPLKGTSYYRLFENKLSRMCPTICLYLVLEPGIWTTELYWLTRWQLSDLISRKVSFFDCKREILFPLCDSIANMN